MPLRPDMELKDYLDILRRRKWLALFSFLAVIFGASVYNVATPEQYKSSTTILIIPQRVPENYVQSTVSVGIEDRLATIQQQVTSRTRLMAVMDELGLFKEERRNQLPEEVLEEMRKRVEIEVVSDKSRRRDRGTEAFVISFVHEQPNMAMLTASRLASLFIDENLKNREQQAVGTSEFLESQLRDTKVKLEAQEERLKQYKLQFMGELPQELQSNLSVLTRLQDQAKTNADGTRAAQDRKVFLEAQLSMIERSVQTVVREDGRVETVPSGGDPYQAAVGDLMLRRARLADLSAKFTDRYPEVVRLRREVEQLEARVAEMRQSASTPDAGSAKKPPVPQPSASLSSRDTDEVRRLKAQIMSTDAEIASLKAGREEIHRQIGFLQAKVDRSPRREQELISLTRDYQNLKQSYDELLKKKLDADISQNLEKRQKGEQFQVIDPANLPTKPFRPDRMRIFGLALLVACGLALGGPIGLEIADPTLRGVRDFKHFFDLPVLACIPVMRNEEYARKEAARKALLFGGVASFTIAVSVFLLVFGQKIRALLNF